MEQLEDRQWLEQKYLDEQLSMTQIGLLVGTTKHPVYRALKKFGIPARVHTSKYPQLNDSDWLKDQYLVQRKSIKQIATDINATVGTVHSALTHLGIKTRSPKESLAIKHSFAAASTTSQNVGISIGAELESINPLDDSDKLTPIAGDTSVSPSIDEIIKQKSGIRLDIGCGKNTQPGFVGMDYRDWGAVDIVHDLEDTPWPLPDDCVITAVASHVLEHINPHNGVFLAVMDEIWRVVKPDGQFAFVVPYAGSPGYWQDPTHCNGITEATIMYFDPDPEGRYGSRPLYNFYEPKPWKIDKLAYNTGGNLECVLRKRRDDKSFHEAIPNDVVEEAASNVRTEPVKKYFSDKY